MSQSSSRSTKKTKAADTAHHAAEESRSGISVPHAPLLRAVKSVSTVCRHASLMPILSNVRLAFTPPPASTLTVTATDLSDTLETYISYDGQFAGNLLLDAAKLTAILKAVAAYTIPLSLAPNHDGVVISCGSSTYHLAGADPAEYPESPALPLPGIILPGKIFADLLALTSYAASRDATRAALCSVRLEFTPSSMIAIATDGFRAIISSAPAENLPVDSPPALIISQPTTELLQNIVDPKGQMEISLSTSLSGNPQACFTAWDKNGAATRIYTRLMDVAYPDVHASVPAYDHHIITPRVPFLNAVYRASAVGSRKEPVTIAFRPPSSSDISVILSMESDGSSSQILHSPLSGCLPDGPPPIDIRINCGWLIQHLEHCRTERLKFEFPGEEYGAITFEDTSIDAKDPIISRHIIMPVRT